MNTLHLQQISSDIKETSGSTNTICGTIFRN